jgi:hypothetical protein
MRIAVATVMYEGEWRTDAANVDRRLSLLGDVLEKASGSISWYCPQGSSSWSRSPKRGQQRTE